MCMNIAVIEKKQLSPRKLNLNQDMFCKLYATDHRFLGNGTEVYKYVYGSEEKPVSHEVAKMSASRFLTDDRFTARINEYLEIDGFNNESVDKKHNFLIKQNKDLNVSLKAIQEFNKLKKRVTDRLEITVPKPIMSWDDDTDTIRKIDKSKAKDISQEQ